MKKFVIITFLFLNVLLLSGCVFIKMHQKENKERIYLTKKYYNKGEFKTIEIEDFDSLKNDKYILFTYNNYCSLEIPCEEIFSKFMKKYNIDFISIPFSEYKNTFLYETVKYAPTVIIVDESKIIAFLDANSDVDLQKYQDEKEFEKWLDNYIYFEKEK